MHASSKIWTSKPALLLAGLEWRWQWHTWKPHIDDDRATISLGPWMTVWSKVCFPPHHHWPQPPSGWTITWLRNKLNMTCESCHIWAGQLVDFLGCDTQAVLHASSPGAAPCRWLYFSQTIKSVLRSGSQGSRGAIEGSAEEQMRPGCVNTPHSEVLLYHLWAMQTLAGPWAFLSLGFLTCKMVISSVQLLVSNSLWPHGLQHPRPPCPSPTPRVYSNSCSFSWWYHPTISPSVVPFSSHLQSFPASGSFQMSQFFASSGQSIGASASTSVLPMNIQGWLPLGWTGWISLQSKGLSRVFSNTTVQKHQCFGTQSKRVLLSHPNMTTGKTIALTWWTFVGKVMSLLFKILSRLVITFLPRSKRLLISWLQSPSAVILEPPK